MPKEKDLVPQVAKHHRGNIFAMSSNATFHRSPPTFRSPHHGRFIPHDGSFASTMSTQSSTSTKATSLPSFGRVILHPLSHFARDTTHTPANAHNGHCSVTAVLPRRCYVGAPRTSNKRDLHYFSVLDDMVVSGVWGWKA